MYGRGWRTNYSWLKLATVAVLSYGTADDQLEYYIQFYQTVNNTVSSTHNTLRTQPALSWTATYYQGGMMCVEYNTVDYYITDA